MNKRTADMLAARKRHFVLTSTVPTGHPGSKRPTARNYKCGPAGRRHNRRLNTFNEWCYERGFLHAVRHDFR